jgi:hypothetical protein
MNTNGDHKAEKSEINDLPMGNNEGNDRLLIHGIHLLLRIMCWKHTLTSHDVNLECLG